MRRITIILVLWVGILLPSLKAQNLISLEQSQQVLKQTYSVLLPIYPEWQNASISETPIIFHDLHDSPFVYLYEIKSIDKWNGYCAISAYDDLPLLNEAAMLNNPISNVANCKRILLRKRGISNYKEELETEFISTGFGQFYVKFIVKKNTFYYNLFNCSIADKQCLVSQQKITDKIRIKKADIFKSEWKDAMFYGSLKKTSAAFSSGQLNVVGFNWYRGCVPTAQGMVLKYIGSRRSIFSDLDISISDFWWIGPTNWTTSGDFAQYNPSNSQRHTTKSLVDQFASYYGFPTSGGVVKDYGIDASYNPGGFTSVANDYGYSFQSDVTSPSSSKVKSEIDNDRPLKGGFVNDNYYNTHAVCIIGYTDSGVISEFWDTYQYSSKKTASTSRFDNLVRVFPDIRVPEDVSTIGAALDLANCNERVIVSSGTFTINNDMTINNGVTLVLKPGVTLRFASGKKLRVNGTLKASSSGITFQSQSGTWYGIEFYYGYSYSKIQGCTIKDAQYGIRMIHTNVDLNDNTIRNNQTGLLFENYSDGSTLINGHEITFNTNCGIRCLNYSDPLIFSCNVIRDNGWGLGGICGDGSSVFDLGRYSDQGHNSIYYNDPYDVSSGYSGTINARYNWWGDPDPYPNLNGNIDWQDYLTYDPNCRLQKVVSRLNASKPAVMQEAASNDTLGISEVDYAYKVYSKEYYQQAALLFEVVVNKYPDHFSGRRALAFLYKCHKHLKNDAAVESLLDNVSDTYRGKEIAAMSQQLSAGESIKQGDYKTAIEKS